MADDILARVRAKSADPDFPNNLSETEWRALVLSRLDDLDRGFGRRLKILYDRIEAMEGPS